MKASLFCVAGVAVIAVITFVPVLRPLESVSPWIGGMLIAMGLLSLR
jgi:hypothetical protein